MKTTWEVRKDLNITAPKNEDSEYKPIERQPKVFNPLIVPKNLQESLPFKSKEKIKKLSKKEIIAKKEEIIPIKSLINDEEKKAFALI